MNAKALSLWEPWATAMRLGVKQNETRSWPTSYTGDLIICASKRKMTMQDLDILYGIIDPPSPYFYKIPYGCAVCIVELMDCIPSAAFHGARALPLPQREAALGNYEIGRWIWRTLKLRPLKEPVPIKGHQGLWIPSPEEQEKIYAQA